MKPVWQTTEFWATIIGNIIGIVVMAGGMTSEQGTELQSALQSIIGGVLSVITICGFIKAQSVRKAAAASVLVAKIQKHAGDPLAVAVAKSLDDDIKKLLGHL